MWWLGRQKVEGLTILWLIDLRETVLGVRDSGIGETVIIKEYRNGGFFETGKRNWWITEEGQEEIDRPLRKET